MFLRSRLLLALALSLAPLGLRGHEDPHAHHAAAPAEAGPEAVRSLERATAALDRFQDLEAAERAGYLRPGKNDGFMMGEHWYQPELLADGACDLDHPDFLQYLVIGGGRRTLIGTGYVCDASAGEPAPGWFGSGVRWHRHGPEVCMTRKGAFMDFSYFAKFLPNEFNAETWRDLCRSLWGTPQERGVAMLHTWNWIAQPDGPFEHENRAIPFLRAGLRVPARELLDSPAGADALETLRLAHGELRRHAWGAFLIVDLGWLDRLRATGRIKKSERRALEAVDRMRDAERLGDGEQWAAAARAGAEAARAAREELLAAFEPGRREIAEAWLASLVVHDHAAL
jgi:hypothetical protein